MHDSYLTRCICESVKNIREVNFKFPNGELYKGIVSFMIVGIKQNTSNAIKSVPEIKIHADWLKDEIIGCLKVLTNVDLKCA